MTTGEITILFQDGTDPDAVAQRGRIVWDDTTRQFFASIIAEACAKASEHVSTTLGVDTQAHATHHQALDKILPWLDAMKRKEEAKAEFWETLVKDNMKRMATALWWLLLGAAVFGLSNTSQWATKFFANMFHL